jgi:hypothetical protein
MLGIVQENGDGPPFYMAGLKVWQWNSATPSLQILESRSVLISIDHSFFMLMLLPSMLERRLCSHSEQYDTISRSGSSRELEMNDH